MPQKQIHDAFLFAPMHLITHMGYEPMGKSELTLIAPSLSDIDEKESMNDVCVISEISLLTPMWRTLNNQRCNWFMLHSPKQVTSSVDAVQWLMIMNYSPPVCEVVKLWVMSN